ncbi:MAG: hypothetical protein DMG96_26115 [Acidobacteria bacterium]|nr:MAG: hypothetical protein DMG98_21865 [Acidobacteriota bacterium]PYV72473.1 MAG: hypothetical protein DMG96_26115 [Acidobacteriota bacterium]
MEHEMAFVAASDAVIDAADTLEREDAIVPAAAYHSHPQWQRAEWLRCGFSISFLHTAHNLIHITRLPI